MKICYFGAYDRAYARNFVLRRGLELNHVQVIECHIPVKTKLWKRYPCLLQQFMRIPHVFDAILVAETNQYVMPLAKMLSVLTGKPLIFDIFFSLYDAYVKDRKSVTETSVKAKIFRALDLISGRLADHVLADTRQHLEYYHTEFQIPRECMSVIYVGYDDTIFFPTTFPDSFRNDSGFLVTFIGTFIPLHGIEYILHAAKQLEHDQVIRFEFVGKGQTYQEMRTLADGLNLGNCVFHGATDLENLPRYIAKSDLCLGIFGNTEKTTRVIPNKVFHALAMKKPIITGDTPAIREVFRDHDHLLLCPVANATALANTILRVKQDESLRMKIAENGHQLVAANFLPLVLGQQLKQLIQSLL